jgi:hypothetical protein
VACRRLESISLSEWVAGSEVVRGGAIRSPNNSTGERAPRREPTDANPTKMHYHDVGILSSLHSARDLLDRFIRKMTCFETANNKRTKR